MILLLESFSEKEDRKIFAVIGIVGLAIVFVFLQASVPGRKRDGSLTSSILRPFSSKRSPSLTTIVVLIMSIDYADTIKRFLPGGSSQSGLGEFFALPVLTCAGMMWMSSAIDFILIFVSLELVTISFYVLVPYMRRNAASLEAGVKYLILSALSTGFTVYGITWIYGVTRQTNLIQIEQVLSSIPLDNQPGASFWCAPGPGRSRVQDSRCAPFQFWVPDVYQGAPTPITAFLSVGSKSVGFIVLLRVVQAFQSLPAVGDRLITAIILLAAATLLYGNLAALPQTNFKRLLAYSSIGHAGYLLMAVAAIGALDSGLAVVVYLAAYLLMTLLSFLVLVIVSAHGEGDDIVHFNGLAKRSPFLAFGSSGGHDVTRRCSAHSRVSGQISRFQGCL